MDNQDRANRPIMCVGQGPINPPSGTLSVLIVHIVFLLKPGTWQQEPSTKLQSGRAYMKPAREETHRKPVAWTSLSFSLSRLFSEFFSSPETLHRNSPRFACLLGRQGLVRTREPADAAKREVRTRQVWQPQQLPARLPCGHSTPPSAGAAVPGFALLPQMGPATWPAAGPSSPLRPA